MIIRMTKRTRTTKVQVQVHRTYSAMVHTPLYLITRTRALLHHHRHPTTNNGRILWRRCNIVCYVATLLGQTNSFTGYIHMFVVWLNYLNNVWVSRKNDIPFFGTCTHMPFHVLVVGFNYVRHVRFSPGPLYPRLVRVLTCHFMCCVYELCSLLVCYISFALL